MHEIDTESPARRFYVKKAEMFMSSLFLKGSFLNGKRILGTEYHFIFPSEFTTLRPRGDAAWVTNRSRRYTKAQLMQLELSVWKSTFIGIVPSLLALTDYIPANLRRRLWSFFKAAKVSSYYQKRMRSAREENTAYAFNDGSRRLQSRARGELVKAFENGEPSCTSFLRGKFVLSRRFAINILIGSSRFRG